jgi:methylmalonyl-CoA/ethylmalonyl-CoA epimerase
MIRTGSETLLRLHHIGFVVVSIQESAPGFVRSLGATWDGLLFADPDQKVKVTFLKIAPGDVLLELVEPNAEDAPVKRFLNDKGQGLHHLCYEVDKLEEALAQLRSKGALIAKPPKPAVAFEGRRIAWLLTTDKLLLELLELSTANA